MAEPEQPSNTPEPTFVPGNEAPSVGKPISSAQSSPTVQPSSSSNAQGKLLAALKAMDSTILRLDKLLSTANGQEQALAVTGYLAHALYHLIASAPWIALQTRLSLLSRLSNRSKSTPNATPSSASQSHLLALSSLISETRYTLRLMGLVQLWAWGSSALKSPPSDPVIHALTLLQVTSNVIFQVLENVGYLASKGIISKRLVDRWGGIGKWDLWSTRAWFGHIFFQFFVLWRQIVLRRKKIANNPSLEKTTEGQNELKAEIRAWRKSLVNNVFWAPLCLHWSVENGIGFPGSLTGVFSFMAGAWGIHDLWVAAGQS